MKRAVALLLAVPVLAGCLGASPGALDASDLPAPLDLLAPSAEAALWQDLQLAPHPAWGWATPTHIPADAPAWWQPFPARPLPAPVAGLKPVAFLDGAHGSERLAVFGRLAVVPRIFETGDYLGARSDLPVTVVDLADPASPRVVSEFFPGVGTADAAIIAYPDGRLVTVLATVSNLLPVWDITDPERPRELTPLATPSPGHNLGLVPGTPILYNANGLGGGPQANVPGMGTGQTEIFDMTDPEHPVLVQEFQNGYGCHTITFYIDAAASKHRAYCAGIEATQIWDIADPLNPRVLVTIPVHHDNPMLPGAAAFPARSTTMTFVNADATTLAVSDEAGFGVPGCEVYVHQDGRTVASPHGALWFYDITDETRPVLKSWLTAGPFLLENDPPPNPFLTPADAGACLAHYGHLVPDASRDLAVVAMFQAGAVLVDFSDPAAPFIVDQWKPEGRDPLIADAWYANGYVVALDWKRGIDVLAFRS